MGIKDQIYRAAKWLVGAGVLILPSCASPDTDTYADHTFSQKTEFLATSEKSTGVDGPGRSVGGLGEEITGGGKPDLPVTPPARTQGKPLPIDLPTALSLTNASPLDVQIAGERLRAATAQLDRAKVLWLPNVSFGLDYFRQDGRIQDVAGNVFTTSKSSFLVGAGPNAVFSIGDALFAPLAAKQTVRARQADVQAAQNDTSLQVAEAYFTVQEARGEVAGSIDTLRRAKELVKLTEKVTPDYAPTVEVNRAKVEAARQRQAVESAYERWQVASAELTRILRLEPGTLVEPTEEPALTVELIDPAATAESLIPIALTYRPELASDQAVIQATLAHVRQERIRPFVPTVVVRGVGSNTPGLAGGYFGGGVNDTVSNFGGRFSVDLQAVWEVQNLGFGNRAARHEREAESRQAMLQLIRTQDRVTAEVVQSHARARRAANRIKDAEDEVVNAIETADKNLKGIVPGKRAGEQLVLVFRPQEAIAAVTALGQAYRDYYAAVADYNRAQFQLYRALGHPAQCLVNATGIPSHPPVTATSFHAPEMIPDISPSAPDRP